MINGNKVVNEPGKKDVKFISKKAFDITSIILTKTDDAYRGRISGLTSIMIGFFPFAGIIFGFLGDYIGIGFTLKISSILGIISLVILSLCNKKIFRTQIE